MSELQLDNDFLDKATAPTLHPENSASLEVEALEGTQLSTLIEAILKTTNPLSRIEPTTEEVNLVLSAKELLSASLRDPATTQDAFAAIQHLRRVRKQPYAEAFRSLYRDLVSTHLDVIEAGITSEALDESYNRLNTINSISIGGEEYKQISLTVLSRHIDTIKAGFLDGVWCKRYDSLISVLLNSNNPEIAKDVFNFFLDTFQNTQGTAQRESIRQIVSLHNRPEAVTHEQAKDFIDQLFQKYNLRAQPFFEAWYRAGAKLPTIEENILSMYELETKEPGSVELLARKFGIANFSRYPEEMLLAQYRSIDDKERPYGIIIYPYADHNGAFYRNKDAFRGLHSQLYYTHNIRIAECESRQQIARTLIKLDSAYGDMQKISFAIIGGHGAEDMIQFGDGDKKRYFIHVDDLAGKGLQRTTKFFAKQPTIMLVSCSTGTESGIGQLLSKTLNARVIAPELPTNLKSIGAIVNQNGTLDFDVKYLDEDVERQYQAGEPIVNEQRPT